jgi:hypothetical protein
MQRSLKSSNPMPPNVMFVGESSHFFKTYVNFDLIVTCYLFVLFGLDCLHRCLGTLLCSRCHVARYCSAVHQRLGWKAHRESCAAMAQRGSDIPDAIESETSNNPFLFPGIYISISMLV